MRFERLITTKHEMYMKAIELYNVSFPFHERREETSQSLIMNNKEYQFNLIYDENNFVGLLLCWETQSFIYVEHFCTVATLTGGYTEDIAGIGNPQTVEKKVTDCLKEYYITLETIKPDSIIIK